MSKRVALFGATRAADKPGPLVTTGNIACKQSKQSGQTFPRPAYWPLLDVCQREGFCPEALKQALMPVIRLHVIDYICTLRY